MEKVFWTWYRKGGALKKVEDDIERICVAFQEARKADRILQSHWADLDTDLVRLLRDHLKQFLSANEIPRTPRAIFRKGAR